MANLVFFVSLIFVVLSSVKQGNALKYYSKERKLELREKVRGMFQHAYEGYLRHASEFDELRPLSCDGVDTWGSYSLTLIDALDSLAIMGNYSEFRRVVNLLESKINFDRDINVSVFETNIRIVGGLLSAHLLSKKAGLELEKGWPCNGPLLRMAEDVAQRLLPAFDTETGMPYGTVNLKKGVPKSETPVTCTAGVTTFFVEFGTLSRLTGNPIYEEVALNAVYAMWERRSPLGLFGNHIDVLTGRWTALDAGIGAGVDSFFEYLVKGSILLNQPDLLELFQQARKVIDMYMKREDWYVWVNMNKAQVTLPVFQSLEAFWPGVLALLGDIAPAMRTMARYSSVWRKYGFLPEFYNIITMETPLNRESYPLRPELIESAMYLYRATKNQFLLELGEQIIDSIEFSAKTKCGYSTIRNVMTHEKDNRMESFFLAETTKYLYLLFDEDNFIHSDGSGELIETEHGQCLIHTGPYIFNTEAHPMDASALYCCHDLRENIYENLDLEIFNEDNILKYEREKWVKREEQSTKYKCAADIREAFNNNQADANMTERPREDARFSDNINKNIQLAVDIEVFDEENNPAGEVLVENFERLKTQLKQEQLSKTGQQLTVQDLNEFFETQRGDFQNNELVLVYVLNFMRNFTLDPGMIADLELFDKNVSLILGSATQKEYEARTRTLWELYELKQLYAVNIRLTRDLNLLAFQGDDNRSLLNNILKALNETSQDIDEIFKGSEKGDSQIFDNDYNRLLVKIYNNTKWYERALVNTTAMQEFLLKILTNGTVTKKRALQPLLKDNEIEELNIKTIASINENLILASKSFAQLFTYVRRIVEFKLRMVETFERLQSLMQENARLGAQKNPDSPTATEDSSVVNNNSNNYNNRTISPPVGSSIDLKDTTKTLENFTEKFSNSSHPENNANDENSVWSQLVQTILRKTNMQQEKFDVDQLLVKTRNSLKNFGNRVQNYELFRCDRPKFTEKFIYQGFYP